MENATFWVIVTIWVNEGSRIEGLSSSIRIGISIMSGQRI